MDDYFDINCLGLNFNSISDHQGEANKVRKSYSRLVSELVQLKLNIGASDGDSTPSEVYEGPTPTYRSWGIKTG